MSTIKDFKDTIERMRKTYPFDDRYTEVIGTEDLYSMEHTLLKIRTYDNERGVTITLESNVPHNSTGDDGK